MNGGTCALLDSWRTTEAPQQISRHTHYNGVDLENLDGVIEYGAKLGRNKRTVVGKGNNSTGNLRYNHEKINAKSKRRSDFFTKNSDSASIFANYKYNSVSRKLYNVSSSQKYSINNKYSASVNNNLKLGLNPNSIKTRQSNYNKKLHSSNMSIQSALQYESITSYYLKRNHTASISSLSGMSVASQPADHALAWPSHHPTHRLFKRNRHSRTEELNYFSFSGSFRCFCPPSFTGIYCRTY